MSTWLSEKEFRQSGGASVGVTINVAFLQEIKTDFGFRDILNETYRRLNPLPGDAADDSQPEPISPREAAEALGELRDGLETYFALEEFYGYFHKSAAENPNVSQKAIVLQQEHERLFLQLNQIVELAEQIVYHERGSSSTMEQVTDELELFCVQLARHEQSEMDLMMRLCNEDFGVGD